MKATFPPILRRLSAWAMLLAAMELHAAVFYVDVNSTSPIPPFTNWATAAAVIQDAVDAATAGDDIVVTNGIYSTGGRAMFGTMTNRVAVDKPLTVRSVNGPQVTIIQGHQVPDIWAGDGAIRCVYLTNGASLSGFTLTNGATRNLGDTVREGRGGGVWCESATAVVSNCVVVDCFAWWGGGGAYVGTLNNCTLLVNFGFNGSGAEACTLNNCVLNGNWGYGDGGGAASCTLNNCTLTSNRVGSNGGGAWDSVLNNCLLNDNSAYDGVGGGADLCTLNNCTLTGNSAKQYGGGVNNCTLYNCIVLFNTAPTDANFRYSTLQYCCATPMPTNGIGNITDVPLFVDQDGGNFRLQSNSPCINAGKNLYATNNADLDGNPRIVGGTADIGAYEFQSPASLISFAWMQQYGLPTDGSADSADPDSDGHNNFQEWKAGTNPTNILSALRMLNPATNSSGLSVSWQSVTDRTYFVERATNLSSSPAFLPLRSNLTGQASTTTYSDTNVVGAGPFFYRVGVQE